MEKELRIRRQWDKHNPNNFILYRNLLNSRFFFCNSTLTNWNWDTKEKIPIFNCTAKVLKWQPFKLYVVISKVDRDTVKKKKVVISQTDMVTRVCVNSHP